MIKVKGNKVVLTGKDCTELSKAAKRVGLTVQNLLTGLLWCKIMELAKQGAFLEKTKKS
jgi:hypothetical protein